MKLIVFISFDNKLPLRLFQSVFDYGLLEHDELPHVLPLAVQPELHGTGLLPES